MSYDEQKHMASLFVREAYGAMIQAYYADNTPENLEALQSVRIALDAMLKPYHMVVKQVDSAGAKEEEHQ